MRPISSADDKGFRVVSTIRHDKVGGGGWRGPSGDFNVGG